MSALPAEVHTAARFNAARTGIDHDDALSITAEIWATHPDAWRTIAHRRCVDQRRKLSGRTGDDRAPLVILDQQATAGRLDYKEGAGNMTLGDIVAATVDGGIAEVETRLDLVAAITGLNDTDLAALARRYWLGMPHTPTTAKAIRHAKTQTVTNALRAGQRLAIVAPPEPHPTRETEALTLAAEGHTIDQIAEAMTVSRNTVKTHLRLATARLKARNTTHAVALALHAGTITMEGTQ